MSDITGWYEIGEVWHLYDDGELRPFLVGYVHIREGRTWDDYIAEHYRQSGAKLPSVTVTEEDVRERLEGYDEVAPPLVES